MSKALWDFAWFAGSLIVVVGLMRLAAGTGGKPKRRRSG